MTPLRPQANAPDPDKPYYSSKTDTWHATRSGALNANSRAETGNPRNRGNASQKKPPQPGTPAHLRELARKKAEKEAEKAIAKADKELRAAGKKPTTAEAELKARELIERQINQRKADEAAKVQGRKAGIAGADQPQTAKPKPAATPDNTSTGRRSRVNGRIQNRVDTRPSVATRTAAPTTKPAGAYKAPNIPKPPTAPASTAKPMMTVAEFNSWAAGKPLNVIRANLGRVAGVAGNAAALYSLGSVWRELSPLDPKNQAAARRNDPKLQPLPQMTPAQMAKAVRLEQAQPDAAPKAQAKPKAKAQASAPTAPTGRVGRPSISPSVRTTTASAPTAPALPGRKWEDFNPNRGTSQTNNPLIQRDAWLLQQIKDREARVSGNAPAATSVPAAVATTKQEEKLLEKLRKKRQGDGYDQYQSIG